MTEKGVRPDLTLRTLVALRWQRGPKLELSS